MTTTQTQSTPFKAHVGRLANNPNGGDHWRFEFPNGYGASVIRHAYSYGGPAGLWEIGVTVDGLLTYDTPITDDVIGRLDEDEVAETLDAIAALPAVAP